MKALWVGGELLVQLVVDVGRIVGDQAADPLPVEVVFQRRRKLRIGRIEVDR
ncbi:hypothetical protein FQZ97_1137440 [compost metagenome]